jgi:hypothetical protein
MGNLFFEVIVRDETYRKVSTWKFSKREALPRFKDMNNAFGLGLAIKENQKIEDTKDNDLNWIK